jgi:hypothetical protein
MNELLQASIWMYFTERNCYKSRQRSDRRAGTYISRTMYLLVNCTFAYGYKSGTINFTLSLPIHLQIISEHLTETSACLIKPLARLSSSHLTTHHLPTHS